MCIRDSHPVGQHAIQYLRLFPGFTPHAHGVVHHDDGQHKRQSKGGGMGARRAPGRNHQRADGGRMGAGHTAGAPHALQVKMTDQKKVDDGF